MPKPPNEHDQAASSPRPRVGAAIDVGSNSVHLLIGEVDRGRVVMRHEESVLLGLGAVVDLEGRIPDGEAEAAIEALTTYIGKAEADGAEWVALLATEPLRRAADRSRFRTAVLEATGLPLHVLSHEEEAELTVLSVLAGEGLRESMLVFDIGGGSSEVVLLEPGADPVVGILPVGSARLTAAHVEGDPPTRTEVDALRAEAHHLLSGMPAGHPTRGVVTGGSGTNLLRLTAAHDDDDDDMRITKERIEEALDIVTLRTSAELIDAYGLRERRVVQMAAGASLIEAAIDCYALDHMEASDRSLREGAILAWAQAGESWRDRLSDLVAGSPTVPGPS